MGYGYDTAGRRTRKTNVTTGETVVFAWLGDQLLEQTAAGGGGGAGATTTWSYLPGAATPLAQIHSVASDEPGVDVPLRVGGAPAVSAVCEGRMSWSQPDVDRAFYALVTDHLGTPTHVIDPASATVAGRVISGLWGQTTWTGEVSTPLRFPGQYFDGETGWHYNRHRYYQPGTGRYVTADPLGLAPAPNPYGYPRNPTAETDPLGLMPCKAIALQNALRDWANRSFTLGSVRLLLDRRDLEHILTRHHLEYWDGSVKRTQTFFAGNPTTDELASIVAKVLRENRAVIIEHGSMESYQVSGWVHGIQYAVGIGKGHIRQLFPFEQ
ncbi:RHS repeat-associated core domain-containing protein [Mycobacterium camsae]|uniref:RHS repeat-associated core domain-containing protein n=1 Tax=Mycobacterium gordonae TaxID=1778 RepID=UPI00197F684B|nr:RHS repeat-associated core domain-containing protein [Mycobacterium gordonae]